MNHHLLAYIPSRKDFESSGLYLVLNSGEEIFDIPNTEELDCAIQYSPGTNLDAGDWYKLESFLEKNFSNDFIDMTTPINTTSLNQLPVDEYRHIEYLCFAAGELKLFQRYYKSQILAKSKKWFKISEQPELNVEDQIVLFGGAPDAVYDSRRNTLYFRDMSKVKFVFSGIDELYRNATNEEVNNFLSLDFVQIKNKYNVDKVGVQNRKRIALLSDTIQSLDEEEKELMISYIKSYLEESFTADNKFKVGSDNDLKNLLFGIDERFYTTVRSKQKRLANSTVDM